MFRRPDQYKDTFKDNTFSSSSWSAETMVSADNIKQLISSFNLVGRKIKRMKIIGLSYNLRREWLEEYAYNYYEKSEKNEKRLQEISDYDNIDPNLEFPRSALIDEPFLIEFEDGESFEIDTPMAPEFCMSMNCIPFGIKWGTNAQNTDANGLFSPCVGKIIESVNVETYFTDDDPMFDESKDFIGQRERVSIIGLRLEDGLELRFGGWVDFCDVDLLKNSKTSMIGFEKLKECLFNWEDIHEDSLIKDEATCSDFYFGNAGRDRIGNPNIALCSDNKDNCLYVSPFDFILFFWSITAYTGEIFDEYADYKFDYEEWNEILRIAEMLVSFSDYNELYEYMRALKFKDFKGVCHTVDDVDRECKNFWDNLNKYKNQFEVMKKWSSRLLSESDKMNVLGF